MRPSLATDRISLGFWVNIRFVVDYRGAVRSIVAIAIDLLTSEDRYFLWITAVPLPRRCLQSRQHSGSRMRGVTLALSGPPNLRPESDHRYLIHLLFHQPISSQKILFTFSQICRACTNSIAIYLSIMRDFIFLCIGPHQQSAISAISSGCSWRQAAEPASWLCNDLSIPRAPENMSHKNIITIYFHIWT